MLFGYSGIIHRNKQNRIMTSAKYDIHTAHGWVIQNLKKYYNSVLPDSVIDLMGIHVTERLLSEIIREPVHIRQTKGGYIAER